MKISTNDKAVYEMALKMQLPAEFLEGSHDTPYIHIEGEVVQKLPEFANSGTGKMLLMMITK